jgi:hypothetical protein
MVYVPQPQQDLFTQSLLFTVLHAIHALIKNIHTFMHQTAFRALHFLSRPSRFNRHIATTPAFTPEFQP